MDDHVKMIRARRVSEKKSASLGSPPSAPRSNDDFGCC
jgi:hypothetical protein